MPHVYVKVYMFQMFCALSHIHSLGVCHRDIKPQNLLVDTTTHALKLCDFGSAKILVRGERNISYICSRYYRCAAAPQGRQGARDSTQHTAAWRGYAFAPTRALSPNSLCSLLSHLRHPQRS